MAVSRFCASHFTGVNSLGFGRTSIGADSAAAARSRASFSLAAGARVTSVSVSSVTFLNQLYNVRRGSCRIAFARNGTTYNYTVPHGAYSVTELLDELVAQFSLLSGGAITYVLNARTSTISLSAGAGSSSFTLLLDPRLTDTILANMLGFETQNMSSTTTHTATRAYCMTRDLSLSLHVVGVRATMSNHGEERLQARTGRMTDAVFTLPLTQGYGAVESFLATSTPSYVDVDLPSQTLTFEWVDSRGEPLDPDRGFQWEVTGHVVL